MYKTSQNVIRKWGHAFLLHGTIQKQKIYLGMFLKFAMCVVHSKFSNISYGFWNSLNGSDFMTVLEELFLILTVKNQKS